MRKMKVKAVGLAAALSGMLVCSTSFLNVHAADSVNGKITVDGNSDDWSQVAEQKSNDPSITWWKAAKDGDGNFYLCFTGPSVTQWYSDYNWKELKLSLKNGWGSLQAAKVPDYGGTLQTVNTANGNTAGTYTVELSLPASSLSDPNGPLTFAGTSVSLADIPVLNGTDVTSAKPSTYEGITIDGNFDDWNAVTKYDASDPNPQHPDSIVKAAMVFDGDHVYLYVQDGPGQTAANAGSHSDGNFEIVTDLGRKAVLHFNQDGSVNSSKFSSIQSRHVGNQWEAALDASQLPAYEKAISFGLYSVDDSDLKEPFVRNVENLHPDPDHHVSQNDGSRISYDGSYDDWKDYPHTEIEYATAGTQETVPDGEAAIYSNGQNVFGHVETEMPEHLNEKGGEMGQAVTIRLNKDDNRRFYPRLVSVDSQGNVNWNVSLNMGEGTHEYYLVDTQGWGSAKTLDELNDGKHGDTVYGRMSVTVGNGKDECEYYLETEKLAQKFNMNANDIQYVEEQFGRIGPQWVGTTGASSGPWVSAALCAGIAGLGFWHRRKHV